MSDRFEMDTRRAPAHWASLIFNADASGMDEADEAACEAWLARLRAQGWQITGTEEVDPWFAHSNDAGTLPGDIYTYEMLRAVPMPFADHRVCAHCNGECTWKGDTARSFTCDDCGV